MDPFADLHRLQREMNRLFSGAGTAMREFPPVNVWANEEEAILSAEIPGINPADLDVTVNGDVLTLEGERKPVELGENDVCHRQERSVGRFTRSVRLPFPVEGDAVEAQYRNGVVEIHLPREAATKPRKIAVQGS
jgi:HSP20 family protein